MLQSLGQSFGAAGPQMVLLVIAAVSLWGVMWSVVQGMALKRERQLLERILCRDPQPAAESFADRLEESSRRLEAAVEPFAAGLERLSGQLLGSIGNFSHRLDNASHNVLQAVEGMRAAAGDLCQSTAGLDLCYSRLEGMYQRFEPLAAQVASSQAGQQERLAEIAGGLHGITESLTTVVAGANESQSTIGEVATMTAGAVITLRETASRLEASVGRMVAALEAHPGAGGSPSTEGSLQEGVSLRCLVEQQQQFINVLDHRLARLDRYSSSSSSNSSSRSSSSISSSGAKTPPPRTLSNQAI